MSPKLTPYEVVVVATTVSTATVLVDAVSEEDANDIVKSSVKPADFEVLDILETHSIEAIEQ